ncbi:MAG: hypothetical protein AVDCRST_MAG19-2908 [uncultured Thermomicrobiales bacterium]|uniref:Uncharacterized protein n=1 Tax=uncultured Thermomicrobiales bacterium TaxID=1645740 RepID=A0A6J4V8G1_9BACT|nr:MAG: hypothetical protein AVDCRST_MAG19-2908 [uncultured Thermomicrobiales bacterium]
MTSFFAVLGRMVCRSQHPWGLTGYFSFDRVRSSRWFEHPLESSCTDSEGLPRREGCLMGTTAA